MAERAPAYTATRHVVPSFPVDRHGDGTAPPKPALVRVPRHGYAVGTRCAERTFVTRILDLPLRFPRAVLALMALITGVFAWHAIGLRVDSSTDNLLPLDDPERSYYERVRQELGTEEVLVIGVFADDVFAPATLSKIDALSRELDALDGVEEVLSLTTVKGARMTDFGLETGKLMKKLPKTADEAQRFRETVYDNELYVGSVVAADGKAAGISVTFEAMSDIELIDGGYEGRVRAIVAAQEGPEEFAIAGIPTLKVFGARYLQDDLFRFMPLSVLIVTLVLAYTFRTARGVLVPLTTVLVGVVWTTGFMVIVDRPINLGTVVLPPLLLAVGVAYAVHMMSRYYEELTDGRSPQETVKATLGHVRLPVGVAALTTLAGFATFILTPIRAIYEFGLFATFGLGVILLASFTVLPAVLVWLPEPQRTRSLHQSSGRTSQLLGMLGQNAVRRRNQVLLCAAAVCAFSIVGIFQIRVDTDFQSFFDPNGPIRTDGQRINDHLAGTQALAVIVEGDGPGSATELEVLAAVRDLQAFLEEQPGVDQTLSIVDVLMRVREVIDPEANPFPESQSAISQLLMLGNPRDYRAALNADESRASILVRTRLSGSTEVGHLVDTIRSFAAERFPRSVDVRPTGTLVLLNRTADTLAWGQVRGLWQVFVVLLALMCVLFLSVRIGFLSLLPNLVPIVILFGVMGWFGISLNISTTLIAAMAIGIAIDDTIHYLGTFSGELRRTGDQTRAMQNATRSVGVPMIVTSLALAAGFLVLTLSNFGPVRDFGLLSAVTMLVALVSDLVVTPAILMTTKIITAWDVLYLKLGPAPQQQIPLFAGLRSLEARIVALMGQIVEVEAGAVLTHAGETRAEMYVLLSGRADVLRNGTSVHTLKRGDVFGEMGLMRKEPRSADVVATTDLAYVIFDEAFVQRIRRRYPRIGNTILYNLTRILSDRLDATTGQLAARATNP